MMKYLYALSLLFLSIVAGRVDAATTWNSFRTDPTVLTDGATITVPCPGTASSGVYYLTLTGSNHEILFPSCPVTSNGLSVRFYINAGNNSGAAYVGLTFASGFNWTGKSPYAICNAAASPNALCPAAETANQNDEFGCDVIGTTSASTAWYCWVQQYNIAPPAVLVAQQACVSNGPGSCTTPPINTTNANLIVVCGAGNSGITFSDSAGNSYSSAVSTTLGNAHTAIGYVLNPITSATATFTITSDFSNLGITAWYLPTPALGATNNNSANGVTSIAAGSISPSATSLVLACLSQDIAGTAATIDSGYTLTLQDYAFTGSLYVGGASAYKFTSGATNPTWSWTGAATAAAVIAAF